MRHDSVTMEALFELLFQVVFEVIGEALFEKGYHGAARVLRSRAGRVVIASVAGFGAGLWWGVHLTEIGRVQQPRALWTSLALAGVAALGALWRGRPDATYDNDSIFAPPWRWPAHRFASLFVLNLAIAAGIIVGFQPRPLG